LPPATTGSFPAVQFNASQKPFVADFSVPIADSHDFEDLTFMVTCWKAKADGMVRPPRQLCS